MPKAERRWQVLIDRQPEKVFRLLPKPPLQRIREAISSLAEDPWPHGCTKGTGYDSLYRIRVGNWRISYALEEDRLIVLVLEVTPRVDAYRF